MVAMHLLLIEDDLDLGLALQQALKAEGLSSEWFRRSGDALQALASGAFDCVLLDLTLPDGDGMDLLARWRRSGITLPVVVITARAELDDRLAGLDGGADDFVVKPFATAELVSRIRAVCRRSVQQSSEQWTFGDLEIEPGRHLVRLKGQVVDLSPREFQLMLELARQAGKVVSKSVLSRRLEPLGEPLEFSAIEVHLSNLRRKIGAHHVRTVRGVGYMLQT
jgi:two-component system response regulator QseB